MIDRRFPVSRHPTVVALRVAIDELSEAAPDLTLTDAGTLSSLQVQLAEIVLQVVKVTRFRIGGGYFGRRHD